MEELVNLLTTLEQKVEKVVANRYQQVQLIMESDGSGEVRLTYCGNCSLEEEYNIIFEFNTIKNLKLKLQQEIYKNTK